MMRKLLLCSALLASISVTNAQSIGQAPWSENHVIPQMIRSNQFNPTISYDLQANETLLGYCNETDPIEGIGVQGSATYDAAIKITKETASALKGTQITMLRIALYNVSGSNEHKIWIKKTLNGKPVMIQNCVFDKAKTFMDFKLDTPYVLDGEEFYIGYSINQYQANTETEKFPIGISGKSHPEGCYMKFNNTDWSNYYSQDFGNLTIQAVCQGEFKKLDASIGSVKSDCLLKGDSGKVTATITNAGIQEINNVDVEYTFNGVTTPITGINVGNLALSQSKDFSFDIVAPQESGQQEITIKITKVNGVTDNNPDNDSTTGKIAVLTQRPNHKVLVEECTGLWCGWCPRGAAAMSRLARDRAKSTVLIAVHSGDKFEPKGYDKIFSLIPGFPASIVNRSINCDPYYGTGEKDFGIVDEIDPIAEKLVVADIEVNSVVKGSTTDVTTNVIFRTDIEQCDYRLAYVLMEDNLTGRQKNYYAGKKGLNEDLARFGESKSSFDMEMNDVAIYIEDYEGIIGSLEGAAVADQPKTHTHSLDLSKVQNIENGKVAVILFDKNNQVVNANVTELGKHSGISETVANEFKPSVTAEYGILNIAGEGQMEVEVFSTNGVKVADEKIEDSASIALNGLEGIHIVRINNGNDVYVTKVIF